MIEYPIPGPWCTSFSFGLVLRSLFYTTSHPRGFSTYAGCNCLYMFLSPYPVSIWRPRTILVSSTCNIIAGTQCVSNKKLLKWWKTVEHWGLFFNQLCLRYHMEKGLLCTFLSNRRPKWLAFCSVFWVANLKGLFCSQNCGQIKGLLWKTKRGLLENYKMYSGL